MNEKATHIDLEPPDDSISGTYLKFLDYVIKSNEAINICNKCSLHDLALIMSNNDWQTGGWAVAKLAPNHQKIPTPEFSTAHGNFNLNKLNEEPCWADFLR